MVGRALTNACDTLWQSHSHPHHPSVNQQATHVSPTRTSLKWKPPPVPLPNTITPMPWGTSWRVTPS